MSLPTPDLVTEAGINHSAIDKMLRINSEALPFLYEKLAYTAMDDNTSTKTRLEIVDSMLKAMSAQKKPDSADGNTFSFTIVMPGGNDLTFEKDVGGSVCHENVVTTLVEANVLADEYAESFWGDA